MTKPQKLTPEKLAEITAILRFGCFSRTLGVSGTMWDRLAHIAALEDDAVEASADAEARAALSTAKEPDHD